MQSQGTDHTLSDESKELYVIFSAIHGRHKIRIAQIVQRIRDSFEAHDIEKICLIEVKVNLADAVTEWNILSFRIL